MVQFKAYGHPNITCKHKNTFEFTKDSEISIEGDCIIGVRADYDLEEIKQFALSNDECCISLHVGNLSESIHCKINKSFDDSTEFVVRRSEYLSKRTFGITSDKACIDFGAEFISLLKDPSNEIRVRLE